MQINVSQLIGEPVGSEWEYQVSDTIDIVDNGNSPLIQGDLKLTRTNRSILVTGKLNTTVGLICARCLDAFNYPLSLSFEEEYLHNRYIGSRGLLHPTDETDLFSIDNDQIIDLTEAIRQYAIMALPMKPLCRQNCSGM